MALLTEERVRQMSNNGTRGPVVVARGDIILGLNRLSSLLWIVMIKLKAGKYGHT